LPLICNSVTSSLHPWNSIRSDNSSKFITQSTNSNPHALRRYTLKSIRLNRTKHDIIHSRREGTTQKNIHITIVRPSAHYAHYRNIQISMCHLPTVGFMRGRRFVRHGSL
jgi:hypothetical protein